MVVSQCKAVKKCVCKKKNFFLRNMSRLTVLSLFLYFPSVNRLYSNITLGGESKA